MNCLHACNISTVAKRAVQTEHNRPCHSWFINIYISKI